MTFAHRDRGGLDERPARRDLAARAAARLSLSACVALGALTFAPRTARAQEYLLGASASGSSGVEGGLGSIYRTRTRVRFGLDMRVDEAPEDILEIGLLAEIEPKSGVGADVRYARAAGKHFVLDAGITSILWPSSIYGVCVGMTYRLPLSAKTQVTLGPEGDFFFLGSDLPSGVMLWQVRFLGGFRVDL